MLFDILRVNFRHDQRHIGAEPECAGVVDKNRTGSLDIICECGGDVVFRRTEDNVEPPKVFGAGFEYLVAVDLLPGRAFACQQPQLAYGKAALTQNFQHLAPDCARCAEDTYIVFIHN